MTDHSKRRCSSRRCAASYDYIVLPLLGVATGASLGILLTLDVTAAISIVATLRHPRRWQYLPVALAVRVGYFFVRDARAVRLADMGRHKRTPRSTILCILDSEFDGVARG